MRPIRSAILTMPLLAAVLMPVAADDHWAYAGDKGPANWGRLAKDFATCASGNAQSPIDLEDTDPVVMNRMAFDYRVTPVDLLNTGHTVQMAVEPGSSFRIGDKVWELVQFHLHTPSEHAVLGVHAPMELHFVHRNAKGAFAVIGVMVTEGEENRAAGEFWQSLPIEPGQRNKVPSVLVNPRDLMPSASGFYRYMGSLTTPPCSEGVNWFVMKEAIEMSAAQIRAAKALTQMNARPLQARNHRMILDSEGTP